MEYDDKGSVKYIDVDLRDRLAGMGIRKGKTIRMITKQPIKGPVVVEIDGANTSLGLEMAKKILVEADR
ncbi:MAG: ferrous iron transport protein A [Methanothrix sp.]|nr:MAG: ferrous iron transport protein A [Methanothrix sp.]